MTHARLWPYLPVLILLDRDGRIVARTDKMDGVNADFMAAAHHTMAAH